MKRILLFVHYNKNKIVANHVLYTLEKISALYERIVIISNSPVNDKDEKILKTYTKDLIVRENVGFDFAAFRDGLNYVGYEELVTYDDVTLMNDTCFGPLYSLEPLYEKYEKEGTDFWGMTNHREYKTNPTNPLAYFSEHLQSYFTVYSRKIVQSKVFQSFWQNIQDYTEVEKVIVQYETKLTSVFKKAGFTYQAVLDTRELATTYIPIPDFSFFSPDVILQEKVPFLKVKAILGNPKFAKYIFDEVEKKTDYPVKLMVEHLSNVDCPDSYYLLPRKFVEKFPEKTEIKQKVAVHLHVYYVDLLEEFLQEFEGFDFAYDLFLTTNTKEKEQEILAQLEEKNTQATLVLTPNKGRDILPLLSLKDVLKKYDVIGHFHTKRSLEAQYFVGESWRKELTDMLIMRANDILRSFEKEQKLGLVIADIPTFFRVAPVTYEVENTMMAPKMKVLWKRMNMEKKIDFYAVCPFTMSYGSFIWARYDALKPIFELDLQPEEVPEEPLPQNTVLHALERMLVYVAWGAGFDFKISENKEKIPAFVDNKILNTAKEYSSIPNEYIEKSKVKQFLLTVVYLGYRKALKDLFRFRGRKRK